MTAVKKVRVIIRLVSDEIRDKSFSSILSPFYLKGSIVYKVWGF